MTSSIEAQIERYASSLSEQGLSDEERAWLLEEKTYELMSYVELESDEGSDLTLSSGLVWKTLQSLKLEHVALAVAISSVFTGILVGTLLHAVSGSGEHVGWLVVVAGEVLAICLGGVRWRTFHGRLAMLLGVAFPGVAVVLSTV